MDPSFLHKSPKGLLKGLGKVLLDSSKALANASVRNDGDSSNEEDSDKGNYFKEVYHTKFYHSNSINKNLV